MELSASFERHSRRMSFQRGEVTDQRVIAPPRARSGAVDDLAACIQTNFVGCTFEQSGLMGDYEYRLPAPRMLLSRRPFLAPSSHQRWRKVHPATEFWDHAGWRAPVTCAAACLANIGHGASQRRIERDGANHVFAARVAGNAVESGEVAQIFQAAHLVIESDGWAM